MVKQDIQKPKDLEGKKVGIFKGSSSEAFFNAFVQEYDLDINKIKAVHMSPPENLTAFIRNDTAALICWEPWGLKARKENGKLFASGHHTYVNGKKEYKKFIGDNSTFFAREDYLEAYPNTILAVLSALTKAADYIENNPDDVANILSQRFKLSVDDVRVMMSENNYTMKIDEEMAEDFTNLINFLYSVGKLKSKPEVNDLIDSSFLKKVKPELVTWEN